MANVNGSKSKMSPRAWVLSIAGFIPFGGLALFILFNGKHGHPLSELSIDMFKVWSAIILSFLGGIRWGAAISGSSSATKYLEEEASANTPLLLFSVLPSIAALFILLLPDFYAIPALMVCYLLQGICDSFSAMSGALPQWMGKLRITLTVLVVSAHALVFLVLM